MIIPDEMVVHVGKIFDGEYEIGYHATDPVILDIGANVGGFAVWAAYRWPHAKIYCFEPIKKNFELLLKNVERFGGRVVCSNVAIGEPGHRQMFYGRHNCGEASLYQGREQVGDGETVKVVHPNDLPAADIVKIDTEGAELEIIYRMEQNPKIFLIEYHSAKNRRDLDYALADYELVQHDMRNKDYGIAKYVLSELLP